MYKMETSCVVNMLMIKKETGIVCVFKKFYLFIYKNSFIYFEREREKERERVSWKEREKRGRGRERIPSRRHTVSSSRLGLNS